LDIVPRLAKGLPQGRVALANPLFAPTKGLEIHIQISLRIGETSLQAVLVEKHVGKLGSEFFRSIARVGPELPDLFLQANQNILAPHALFPKALSFFAKQVSAILQVLQIIDTGCKVLPDFL
jgi:hypothetical protein